MTNNQRKHCIHECTGADIDHIWNQKEGDSINKSRDCEFFVKQNHTETVKIEDIIKAKGQYIHGARCPFLFVSGITQEDCPYFK